MNKEDTMMKEYYCNAEYMEDKLEALEKENAELKRQIKMLEWELLDEKLCRAFEGVEI